MQLAVVGFAPDDRIECKTEIEPPSLFEVQNKLVD